MKTQDVKCNKSYLYKGEVVTVMQRIPGKETTKANMQSGVMFTGFKRTQKKFLLDNGETVFAKDLFPDLPIQKTGIDYPAYGGLGKELESGNMNYDAYY